MRTSHFLLDLLFKPGNVCIKSADQKSRVPTSYILIYLDIACLYCSFAFDKNLNEIENL